MEIQNNGFGDGSSALDALVDAMNAKAGAGTYACISGPYKTSSGGMVATAGSVAIMVALIYKPAHVTPVGNAVVPDTTQYDAFSAAYGNRVPVAQAFRANGDGELDYNVENKSAAQQASYFDSDAYRSSDHNPILIGLNLGPAPTPLLAPLTIEKMLPQAFTNATAIEQTSSQSVVAESGVREVVYWQDVRQTAVTLEPMAVL